MSTNPNDALGQKGLFHRTFGTPFGVAITGGTSAYQADKADKIAALDDALENMGKQVRVDQDLKAQLAAKTQQVKDLADQHKRLSDEQREAEKRQANLKEDVQNFGKDMMIRPASGYPEYIATKIPVIGKYIGYGIYARDAVRVGQDGYGIAKEELTIRDQQRQKDELSGRKTEHQKDIGALLEREKANLSVIAALEQTAGTLSSKIEKM